MIHPLDAMALVGFWLAPRASSVFPAGWGDRLSYDLFGQVPAPNAEIPDIDPIWGRKEEHLGFRVCRGHMISPVASQLPESSRVVPLELVQPAGGANRIVLFMPAWNDHGFERRRKLARGLVQRGVGSLMFDIPFYGGRRSVTGDAQAIRTVADFALMGFGAIHEARSLLAWLNRESQPGVAGFSMGGNLAALASTTIPFATAVAPLAAAYSPGPVYLDGILNRAIVWEALGGREEAAAPLRKLLSSVSVLGRPPLPHHRSAVLVAGRNDGFVPPGVTRSLAEHWPGSELVWVERAGHATLVWRHRDVLVDAIARSFERTFGAG